MSDFCSLCDVHKKSLEKMGYSDLNHWLADPNNAYIGRGNIIRINNKPVPEFTFYFANPFKVDKDGVKKDGNLYAVLDKYWAYIIDKIKTDPNCLLELKKLKGKRLGCWCVNMERLSSWNEREPWICHGQILIYLVDYYYP